MPLIHCPECGTRAAGANAFWGYEKPYCSLCGWNIPAAIETQRALLQQFRLALYIATGFFALLAFFTRDSTTLIVFLFLLAILLAVNLLTSTKIKTLTRLQQATGLAAASVNDAKEKARLARNTKLEHVRSLPRPRRVRLKIVPRVIAVLFPVSFLFILYFGFQLLASHSQAAGAFPDDGSLLVLGFMLAIWSGICLWILARARRDRRLLQDGEIALATITSQWMEGQRHPAHKVAYTFSDASGQQIESQTTDSSRSLYERMETWVLYDPLNPQKHILAPCAYCEVKGLST
jgi:hypothetical protein